MTKTKRNIIIIVAVVVAVIGITLAIVLPLTLNKDNGPYTVTFESNGGTSVESLTDVKHGSLIAEPAAPTKLGYTLEGWFRDENLSNQWKFDSDKVTSDITLYAKWKYNETRGLTMLLNGTSYTIAGIGTVTDGDLVIPTTYKGLPVTAIAERAFENVKLIQTVYVPSSVNAVMNAAFRNCENLVSVIFDGQSTTLGEQVFYNCKNLQSVKLPEGLTKIEKQLFCNCEKLTDVAIPEGVTSIGYQAFSSCKSIVEINLPKTLTALGENAFASCISLERLSVDYGNQYFYSRDNGEDLNCIIAIAPNGEAGNKLVAGCKTTVIRANSDRPVKVIGQGAFYGCITLEKIVIPNSVTKIEDDAFQYCGLTSIIIPASVESIGDRAFSSCESLLSVEFISPAEGSDDSGIKTLGQEAFSHCYLLGYQGSGFQLRASLESIGAGLLLGCDFGYLTVSYDEDASGLQWLIQEDKDGICTATIVKVVGKNNSEAMVNRLA